MLLCFKTACVKRGDVMKTIIAVLTVFLLVWSCQTSFQADEKYLDLSDTNIIRIDELAEETNIYVSQAELTFIFRIKPYDSVNKKYYAYRLTAYLDSSIFDYVKDNTDKNEIPFFSFGTGMAPSRSGRYDDLVINNKANHYLVYDKDSIRDQRVDLMSEDNGHLLVKVSFDKIFNQGIQMDFKSLSGVTLYLIAYYDKNLNDIVEKGEYKKLALIFK